MMFPLWSVLLVLGSWFRAAFLTSPLVIVLSAGRTIISGEGALKFLRSLRPGRWSQVPSITATYISLKAVQALAGAVFGCRTCRHRLALVCTGTPEFRMSLRFLDGQKGHIEGPCMPRPLTWWRCQARVGKGVPLVKRCSNHPCLRSDLLQQWKRSLRDSL